LLGIVSLGLGWLFDRSLVERQATAEASAVSEARETAHLGAMTLRATIAQLELSIVAGVPPRGVTVTTFSHAGSRRISHGRFVPYAARSSSELVTLLSSEGLSPSGIPEAVAAALALQLRGAPNAELRTAEVASRLLSGQLAVSARDFPELARRLGVEADARAAELERALDRAPAAVDIPPFPAFCRNLTGDQLEGWSLRGRRWVQYSVVVDELLREARLPELSRVSPTRSETGADVPDVLGLFVSVEPARRAQSLIVVRIGLWAALLVSGWGLAVYLRALAREERALGREKRFLANVTHELKTPLAALRILGESLQSRRGDPVEYGELISRETTRLHDLVDRVLTATRLDEAPRLRPVNPGEIAESSIALLRQRAESRSVCLRADLEAGRVPEALWDGDAVRRALLNLLENAIQHGGAGGTATLRMELLPDAVRFVVCDRGPGIRPRDRKRVFERFVRGDSESPGTGLGLYVVEQVARAHGGRVDLETAPGEGCRFSLTLPTAPAGNGRVRGRVQ
jgi:signal transduction histidine kinase